MNSDKTGTIHHEGIVQKVDDKSVIVSIISTSACAGCHSESSCTLSGQKEKIIEVTGNYNVRPGDNVTVLMKQSMGHAAVLLGYFLPFVAVVTTLTILVSFDVSEFAAGLISLSILIPYYSIMYFFRRGINKKFTFTIKT